MTKRMLIDATHTEETRVAVVSGNKLEEYDFESAARKQLKGNIYLVKVTRVEPSLQAAFVDFGGNRHGFLPFPEIHPDYYKIPVADREALIEEERKLAEAEAARKEKEDAEQEKKEEAGEKTDDDKDDAKVETVGGDDDDEDEVEEMPQIRHSVLKRQYKIQEVIKRGQIMLVQISKEERGNKGAAVTTYISLPGRYCVLMPNSPRAGGVSRKVTSVRDRRKLKSTLNDMNVPDGMSVIMRTAGVSRNKSEIKRDLDYLLRLWDNTRELTMKSTAPALIHEEGSLIKRAIRDLYRRDIDEVQVAGDDGYRAAKDFMKTLMPSHAKRVQPYKDEDIPLFFRYQVEGQIDEIHSPTVHLKSGGYLVINPTEALVSIDINSGRATKGRHIEETALRTNVEAAEEIARQLRLRDLGGLVVIDFIDMEENRNNKTVERKLKDAMQQDRARIQLGHISPFGLLELSRQRLRPSLVESNFETCDHCQGMGLTRTIETSALQILRAIEEEGLRGRAAEIKVTVQTKVALYIFNTKRAALEDIEKRYDFRVFVEADDTIVNPDYKIDVQKDSATPQKSRLPDAPVKADDDGKSDGRSDDRGEGGGRRKRRRRRGRRGGAKRNQNRPQDQNGDQQQDGAVAQQQDGGEDKKPSGDDGEKKPGRSRGRRGGRRRRKPEDADGRTQDQQPDDAKDSGKDQAAADKKDTVKKEAEAKESDKKESGKKAPAKKTAKDDKSDKDGGKDDGKKEAAAKKKPATRKKAAAKKDDAKDAKKDAKPKAKKDDKKDDKADKSGEVVDIKSGGKEKDDTSKKDKAPDSSKAKSDDGKPARKGWWQRASKD